MDAYNPSPKTSTNIGQKSRLHFFSEDYIYFIPPLQ